jgi:hypothetical protein
MSTLHADKIAASSELFEYASENLISHARGPCAPALPDESGKVALRDFIATEPRHDLSSVGTAAISHEERNNSLAEFS